MYSFKYTLNISRIYLALCSLHLNANTIMCSIVKRVSRVNDVPSSFPRRANSNGRPLRHNIHSLSHRRLDIGRVFSSRADRDTRQRPVEEKEKERTGDIFPGRLLPDLLPPDYLPTDKVAIAGGPDERALCLPPAGGCFAPIESRAPLVRPGEACNPSG